MKRATLAAIGITAAAACVPAAQKAAPVQDILGELNVGYDWLAWRMNGLHRIPPDEWIELKAPEEIRDAREYHTGRTFLSPLAYPFHEGRPVQLWAHIGPVDVLRMRYEALSFQIELVSTAALTLLWAAPAPPPGADQEPRLREAISKLLLPQREWFFFPGRRGETIRFSTDRKGGEHNPDHGELENDGGIVGGRLYLVRYKSKGSRSPSSWKEPPPNDWFLGPIKDAWDARRPGR